MIQLPCRIELDSGKGKETIYSYDVNACENNRSLKMSSDRDLKFAS